MVEAFQAYKLNELNTQVKFLSIIYNMNKTFVSDTKYSKGNQWLEQTVNRNRQNWESINKSGRQKEKNEKLDEPNNDRS